MNKEKIIDALKEIQIECKKCKNNGIMEIGKVVKPTDTAIPRLSPCTLCPYSIEIEENVYRCMFSQTPEKWALNELRKENQNERN